MNKENNRSRRPNKMPSENDCQQMVKLHHLGYGTRKIAERGPWTRKIVRQVIEDRVGKNPPQPSKVEPYRMLIEDKARKGLTTTRILREIREAGYTGGRTILAEAVRQIRHSAGMAEHRKVKRRFETGPSTEMQIDWSPYKLPIGDRLMIVKALGCLCCFSRKLYLHFFTDERQPTLLEGLAMAFEYFGGCAHRLVLDNMSTAVLGRFQPNDEVLWSERFRDFTSHYGLTAFACKPNDPDRKGKKEKSFRLVWDDFLKGATFASIEDLNARARVWLDQTPEVGNLRRHGTTCRVPNQAFEEERSLLIELPERRFPVFEQAVRVVDNDCTVSVRGTRYSVPSALASRSVAVRLFAEHFEVLDHQGRTAMSRRYVLESERGRLIIDPTHYANLRPRSRHGAERLDEAFVARFPTLAPLVRGLKLRMKGLAGVHLRALLRLIDRYGVEDFLAAAQDAQAERRFNAQAVQRILLRRHGPGEDPPARPMGVCQPDLVPDLEPADLGPYATIDTDQQPHDAADTDDQEDR